MNTAAEIIAQLRTLRSPRDAEGQRRFGIAPRGEHLGIRAPVLREIARRHRRDHALALELWAAGLHEARVLAALIDDPARVTRAQMEQWARECDNWGVTARMSIDFRKPVTVGQAIRAEGWITESRRRIQVTAGRIVDASTGAELATAVATYVAASDARKRELKERYGVAESGSA